MTGGVVVVLGPVGRNFGAGMSNGVAYVLDESGVFPSRCNLELVEITVPTREDARQLAALLRRHRQETGSLRALAVLRHWPHYRALFRKVAPRATVSAPVAASADEHADVGTAETRV
jgi:glutamate synthase domain-containing protein 3